MTDEEKVIVEGLCKRINDEQDPVEFSRLVAELNGLLDEAQERLDQRRKKRNA
jgi:hypothetical protein